MNIKIILPNIRAAMLFLPVLSQQNSGKYQPPLVSG